MATNRRSRTSCDPADYTTIERDLSESTSTELPRGPLLPSIENSDPDSLFKWARSVNVAFDEWFDQLDQVLLDNEIVNNEVINGGNCYCFKVCADENYYECDAVDLWTSDVNNSSRFPWLQRHYITDDYPNASSTSQTVQNLGSRDDVMRARIASTIIVNASVNTAQTFTPCDIEQIGASSRDNDYFSTNSAERQELDLIGMGEDFTYGALIQPSYIDNRTYAIFAWGNEAVGNAGYQVAYNGFSGYVYVQRGGDNFEYVRARINDERLKSAIDGVRYFIHLVVRVVKTSSVLGLHVWANGAYLGYTSSDTTNDGTPIADWDGYVMDSAVVGNRHPNWAWGGNGDRQSHHGKMIWTWGGPGDLSGLGQELQYKINQNDPTFVDPNPGFSPDLGDMLYVQSIDPETGEETWCTTPQYNFDLVSGAVPAVGDTVTYVGLDAKGVPLYEPTSIVPLGGTTDQQLYKVSTEDYDLEWKTRASQTFFGRSEPSNWIVGDLWGQGYE